MSKQKRISKQVKLFVRENRGGTIRKVGRSSSLMDAFLMQHFNRWMEELMELNKESIEAKKTLTDQTLQIPSQEIPEKTYDMIVKSLKPAKAGSINNPSFIIFMETPHLSHPLVRFVRVKEEAPDVKKSSRGNELVDQSDKDDKDVATAKPTHKEELLDMVDTIEDKLEQKKARAKVNRAKLKAKRAAEAAAELTSK